MPLKLASQITSPPGGHFFFITPTGQRFGGNGIYPSRVALRSAMRSHCVSHHIPIPTDAEIDEFMCKEMPPGVCVDAATGMDVWQPDRSSSGLNLSFSQVIQGTRTLGYWATHGRPRVEGALAERRASTCSSCAENQPVSGCEGCNLRAMLDAISSVVQGQATTKDGLLGACKLCGCHLRAKVWLPLDILLKYSSSQQMELTKERAPHCWQLKEQEAKVA